jgi:ferredoxin, 2Fe-2S
MHVSFRPLALTASTHPDETVLDAARRAGAPLGNSCGGVGVCARCRVTVVEGAEKLSPPTTTEARVAVRLNLDPGERLACQAIVLGDCIVTTTYW